MVAGDRVVRTMMVRLLSLAAILLPVARAFPNQTTRPRISAIAFVRFKAVDLDKSIRFYSQILGLPSGGSGCHGFSNPCFVVNPLQHLEFVQTDSHDTASFLDEVGFTTNDLAGMRSYLANNGVKASEIVRRQNGRFFFEVSDPEHNHVAFVEASQGVGAIEQPNQVSHRLFHAGWVVKNLEIEKKFYCDVLGFRLYWYGGFKDAGIDWYEIQVPDGDNWVEFMLNIPATADHKELGIQNHFSLGVPDISAAEAKLRANGLSKSDKPEIGRDGKWSFDIYDPDDNRVEFMEPTNAAKPCCHAYTAPHPKL